MKKSAFASRVTIARLIIGVVQAATRLRLDEDSQVENDAEYGAHSVVRWTEPREAADGRHVVVEIWYKVPDLMHGVLDRDGSTAGTLLVTLADNLDFYYKKNGYWAVPWCEQDGYDVPLEVIKLLKDHDCEGRISISTDDFISIILQFIAWRDVVTVPVESTTDVTATEE